MILLFCVGIPLIGSFFLPLIGKHNQKARSVCALALVSAAFLLAVLAAVQVLGGHTIRIELEIPLGLSMGFYADPLAVFMALTSCVVGMAIVIYSFGYMAHYDHLNEFYMMVVFFIGAMMGLVFSTNLIEIYLFWECSSLCCWRLIGFYRDPLSVRRADKAFIVTVLGALVMLLGFLGIWGETGSFRLEDLQNYNVPTWIAVCILAGVLSKSATFPLHNWLPDAGVAPSPVTSLLHAAVLVKIGVYIYCRLFGLTFASDPLLEKYVPIVAAVSALYTAGCALKAMDLKRVVAYSTISQLAFILLGISVGTRVGVIGGLLYILCHSIAKAGLFLCCGIVEHTVHTKDLTKIGGLMKTMPYTALAFILCAFSVMGIPPFSGFFAKYLVIAGALEAGRPLLAAVFIFGAVLTVLYLVRLFRIVFLGKQTFLEAREESPAMIGSVLFLAILALVLGFFMSGPSGLASLIGVVI
ncbi:MAG: NADH-quinone oxidoreductase subunit L [Clostridia bacterium]|nr:NADH-quinone oxidoreductase subunit L [Clostridia bacterium]